MVPKGSWPYSQEPATYFCPEPDRSCPCSHLTSWRSIVISVCSIPGSSKWSLLLKFPHLILFTPLLSHIHILILDLHFYIDRFNRIIFREEYRSWAPRYVVFSTICYLTPLWSKYFLQHPALIQPRPVFLPQCEGPSLTPIQKRQNYKNLSYRQRR